MKKAIVAWGQQKRVELLLGLSLWILLAVGGGLYANLNGLPMLPTIVSWDEWVAAIMLFPLPVAWLGGVYRRDDFKWRRARAVLGFLFSSAWAGLVIFALDVLTRAVFGLGFKPF